MVFHYIYCFWYFIKILIASILMQLGSMSLVWKVFVLMDSSDDISLKLNLKYFSISFTDVLFLSSFLATKFPHHRQIPCYATFNDIKLKKSFCHPLNVWLSRRKGEGENVGHFISPKHVLILDYYFPLFDLISSS